MEADQVLSTNVQSLVENSRVRKFGCWFPFPLMVVSFVQLGNFYFVILLESYHVFLEDPLLFNLSITFGGVRKKKDVY